MTILFCSATGRLVEVGKAIAWGPSGSPVILGRQDRESEPTLERKKEPRRRARAESRWRLKDVKFVSAAMEVGADVGEGRRRTEKATRGPSEELSAGLGNIKVGAMTRPPNRGIAATQLSCRSFAAVWSIPSRVPSNRRKSRLKPMSRYCR